MAWFGSLRRWLVNRRPTGPSRSALIDRKHRLEGEIRELNRRINVGVARGKNVGQMQARLERLRAEQLETRMRIDRTPN